MKKSLILTATIAATLVIGLGQLYAAKPAAVEQRQAAMKAVGKASGAIQAFLKEGKGTPADVATAADTIAQNIEAAAAQFPAGTSSAELGKETAAKPEIWANLADFEAKAKKTVELAKALKAAAASGDQAAIAAAAGALGKEGCGACHGAYREKQG